MDTTPRRLNRRTLVLATGAAGISLSLLRSVAAQNGTGAVRIGVSEDGYRVDERANVGFYPLNTNIFESLVYMTPDYQIEPMLAESWETSEDGLSYTFAFTDKPEARDKTFEAYGAKICVDCFGSHA